ncbi:MarR family winged helix-turn-helix transcriptional regulator [Devosia sp.]|uniref:MarR family winged helix-turn-helix transcriptional regulator n=1 Tax=Devosia sp. TaxID=1871048 RepID=UPI003A8D1E6C
MSNLPAQFATTLEVRDSCLCLAVHRAARRLARRFDKVFRPLGITHGQFSLLNGLNRPTPPTMAEVAQLLAMDRTTLTAALKPLEKSGHVRVVIDAQDRRQRRLLLNDSGRTMLEAAWPLWRLAHQALEAETLAEGEAAALRQGLAALAA